MFAAGGNNYTYIYNFYTVECMTVCTGHAGKITGVDWFDDDSGFSDSCSSGLCSIYNL